MTGQEPDVRLDEMDKNEWFDVCRRLRPDWTAEQFEEAWREFVETKRPDAAQRRLD